MWNCRKPQQVQNQNANAHFVNQSDDAWFITWQQTECCRLVINQSQHLYHLCHLIKYQILFTTMARKVKRQQDTNCCMRLLCTLSAFVAEADCFKLFANVINELSNLETNHRCHMICNTLAILWLCWQNIMTIVNMHWSHTGAFNYTVTYTTYKFACTINVSTSHESAADKSIPHGPNKNYYNK